MRPSLTLASYLPRYQRRLIAEGRRPGQDVFAECSHAAILMVDISGFTALTERLAKLGAAGAEQLSGILNLHFGRIAEITESHGGDIVAFAGDSAIAMWPGEESLLTANLNLAVQAALKIQSELDASEPHSGLTLRQRAGVACGTLHIMELGGVGGRWQFVVTGEPLVDAAGAQLVAKAGEVVLSPAAWGLMKDFAVTPDSGAPDPGNKPARVTAVREDSSASPSSGSAQRVHDDGCVSEERFLSAFEPYVARVVVDRLRSGQEDWIAEFRNLTMLFVNLGKNPAGSSAEIASLHQTVGCVQEVLERFEGTLYQFLMDDKGLTAACGFGLPPLAHENDARRATEAAIELRERLNARNIPTSVGIATGTVFCGIYGSETRRQYTVLGNTVNLAARLMQAANGSLWCDEATCQAASAPSLQFERQGEVALKGRSSPVAVFAPALRSDSAAELSHGRMQVPIGREAELEVLAHALLRLAGRSGGGCILVEGEAGSGKSCLLSYFSWQVEQFGRNGNPIACWSAAADPIQQSTPYHVWRTIFRDVLELSGAPVREQRLRVLAALEGDEILVPLAPLLNVLLSLDFPETAATAALEGQARAQNTEQLLLGILKHAAMRSPVIVILEDAHWCDASSLRLALLVLEQIPEIELILSSRPQPESPAPEFAQLIALPVTRRLALDALKPEYALQMVCRSLGVSGLPPEVERVIEVRAAGNPLFSEQLAYALRDNGLIAISDGQCRITESVPGASLDAALTGMRFPSTVEGVVTSRLDRTTPGEQLTVKIASVIGQSFRLELLGSLYPVEDARSDLPSHLNRLEKLNLVQRSGADSPLYAFSHVVVRDAAYNSVPFARRRQLHRSVAEWYEREFESNLAPHLALLAHHWTQAESLEKAVYYCSEAGKQSLRNHANPEAARLFSEALRLDESAANGAMPRARAKRRSEWELHLGKAYVNWSKYVEGRAHLERGLSLQGQKIPLHAAGAAAALLKEVAEQVVHRLMPRRLRPSSAEARREKLLQFSRTFEALTEIYYLQDEPLRCLHAVFRSLNLAEAAGPSPELVRGYSSVASLLGFMTMHRVAEFYFDLSARVSRGIADPASNVWVALARSVYLTGVGQWDVAATLLEQAIAVSDSIGDRRRGDDARITLTLVQLYQAKFSESLRSAELLYKSAKERLDIRIQAEALHGKAWNLLLLGQLQELPACIRELDLLRSAQMKIGGWHRKQDVHSLYALLDASNGEFARASEHAGEALAASHGGFQLNHILIHSAILEVQLRLLAMARQGAPGAALPELSAAAADATVREALKRLRGFCRVFPIGKPLLHLSQAEHEWIKGNSAAAIKQCELTLVAARSLKSEYYEALAHRGLAIYINNDDSDRSRHLREAESIFSRLGAARDLSRLRSESKIAEIN
jgi:class 3 adenylate cyclase